MGDAGRILIFMFAMVGCGIWSTLYLTFVAHYFLVTFIDSSAGHAEIQFPREGLLDWWWKPIFCLWLLAFWIVTGGVFLSPFLACNPWAFVVVLALLVWIAYPVSVLSTLFTQNWLFFLHPIVLWRMLRHYKHLAYVHLVTLFSVSACVGLLFAVFAHSFAWTTITAFVLPAVLLFYARTWGRFSWLALHFLPRKQKTRTRSEYAQPLDEEMLEEDVPTVEVEEVDETSTGVREGLPPAYPHAIQAALSTISPPIPFIADEGISMGSDESPYQLVGDTDGPIFQETTPAPVNPTNVPSGPPHVAEEEDEWATDKKPYVFAEHAPALEPQADANKPIVNSEYYDERAKKEKVIKAKRQRDAEEKFMPTLSKKTPPFSVVLLKGVGTFMIDSRTLGVYVNLVVMTVVELLLILLVVQFWPKLD